MSDFTPATRQSAPINHTCSHPHLRLKKYAMKNLVFVAFLFLLHLSLTDIHKHTLINKKPHIENRAFNYICTIASMKYVISLENVSRFYRISVPYEKYEENEN